MRHKRSGYPLQVLARILRGTKRKYVGRAVGFSLLSLTQKKFNHNQKNISWKDKKIGAGSEGPKCGFKGNYGMSATSAYPPELHLAANLGKYPKIRGCFFHGLPVWESLYFFNGGGMVLGGLEGFGG